MRSPPYRISCEMVVKESTKTNSSWRRPLWFLAGPTSEHLSRNHRPRVLAAGVQLPKYGNCSVSCECESLKNDIIFAPYVCSQRVPFLVIRVPFKGPAGGFNRKSGTRAAGGQDLGTQVTRRSYSVFCGFKSCAHTSSPFPEIV